MKWFNDIDSPGELRKLYKKLVIQHHPDNGGSEEVIKEINSEYDTLFRRLKDDFEHKETYENATDKQKQQYDWQKDQKIRNMILLLAKFEGITVEIAGTWIWVSDCYQYRKELKELGFHWAREKKRWYIHFDDHYRSGSRPVSMGYIRNKYGSVEIRYQKEYHERLAENTAY